MSEIGAVRSNGTLQLINGKKYRGELVAGETGAAFYVKGQEEPVAEWHYARMNRMDNIRRGGTSSQVTVILKDDTRYVFELAKGLKLYSQMDKNWVDKPAVAKTRGDILHEQAERLGEKIQVKKHLITRRHPNRSIAGDIIIYLLLLLVAVAMAFPLVFLLGSSLKPLDELFRFPPPVWPSNPTMDNFSDLFVTMGQSWVPFSRYLVNTVIITAVGTFGHLVFAGMAAFVLAKYEFPGGRLFFLLATTFLMFASGVVTDIPNYLIMSRLGLVDTYWALILPAFAAPIGLFLMKQFMEGLPTALIEAATIDGANRFRVFWSIVMPNVKPAWLTMIIFSVQSLWNNRAATIIYSEAKKPLVYALQQIQAGGVARTGQTAAANVIIVAVPVLIFIFSQSRILETMASSGIKD